MIVQIKTFEELVDWYSDKSPYKIVAYKFTNSYLQSPCTSNMGAMVSSISDEYSAFFGGFVLGETLEILY